MAGSSGKSGNVVGTPMDARDQGGFVGTKKVALGLGYFSIALGLVELAAPGRLARWLGVDNKAAKNTVVAMGVRELLAGGMLLRGPAVSTNVWNRVIGDTIDAGALGIAITRSSRPANVALAAGIVAGAFVADLLTARALDRKTGRTFPRLSRPNDPVSSPASGEVKLTNLQPADLAAV
jgi:hypothetical protein